MEDGGLRMEEKMEEKANFEKLRVYQQALLFVEMVYQITKSFPKEEQYGLTSQFRRAAMSIPLNIAEGQGRSGRAESKQFLQISKASLHEILAVLEIAYHQKYLSQTDRAQIRRESFSIIKQIQGMINYLKEA